MSLSDFFGCRQIQATNIKTGTLQSAGISNTSPLVQYNVNEASKTPTAAEMIPDIDSEGVYFRVTYDAGNSGITVPTGTQLVDRCLELGITPVDGMTFDFKVGYNSLVVATARICSVVANTDVDQVGFLRSDEWFRSFRLIKNGDYDPANRAATVGWELVVNT